ncbi:MAG TPA: hypothetical protein VMA09_02070 [Candidatus Binataceae bacterium]|nr:hypothetical protein [Candidatus Binataceae bacterium]
MRIVKIATLAIIATTMSACWFYSHPEDTTTGCRKTSYGVLVASSQTEACPDPGAPPGVTAAPPTANPAPQ